MLENLTKLGFSEKEAKIYLILLRNGPALASTLAIRTGLKRVSVYSILDALCSRGVVSYELSELGRRYLPHDPECLLYGLEKERAELQVKLDLAKNCVSSLSEINIVQQLDARRVIFLKSLAAIQSAMPDLFNKTEKLYALCSEAISPEEEHFLTQLFSNTQNFFKEALILTPKCSTKWAGWAKVTCLEHPHPSENGQILVQGSQVFFVCQRQELELMLIRDASYAKTVLEVMIKPYCNTSGVLALNSTCSFLKG